MADSRSPASPPPPGLVNSLMAGFDATASHLALILFPIALDLLLWLGPHLRIKQVVEATLQQMMIFPGSDSPQTAEMMRINLEMWHNIGDRVNLLALLRTYPVGIPSLMAGSQPVEAPGGTPLFVEMTSFASIAGLALLFTLAGLLLGTLYYSLVAQAALDQQVNLSKALQTWPKASLQVIGLTFVLSALLLSVLLPTLSLVSVLVLVGLPLGQCALFALGGLLLWLAFPLLLAAHGIFVNGDNLFASIVASIRLSRQTLPTTSLLFLSIVVLSQGLNLLWSVPDESSWVMLVGVGGHAFVTTALLAGSFVYYRQAEKWIATLAARRAEQGPKPAA